MVTNRAPSWSGFQVGKRVKAPATVKLMVAGSPLEGVTSKSRVSPVLRLKRCQVAASTSTASGEDARRFIRAFKGSTAKSSRKKATEAKSARSMPITWPEALRPPLFRLVSYWPTRAAACTPGRERWSLTGMKFHSPLWSAADACPPGASAVTDVSLRNSPPSARFRSAPTW